MADPAVGYDGNPIGPSNGGTTTDNSAFLKQLAAALAAVGGGIGGRAIANSQGNPLTSAVPPQLSQLLDMSNQRYAYQNPLFQATTQGAYAMLPDFAKTGTSLSGSLPSSVPSSPASGSGSGPGVGTAAGIGGAAALTGLLSNPSSLEQVFAHIKSLFGGGAPSSGAAGGPASPGTFGKGPAMGAPGQSANPSNVGTPFDVADQGGPSDLRAVGSDQIAQLIRILGGGGFGSAREPGGPPDSSAGTVGYV